MDTKIKTVFSLILAILVTACGTIPASPVPSTGTPSLTPLPASETPTSKPSLTPSPTILFTATPLPPEEANLTSDCVTVEDNPVAMKLDGIVFLDGRQVDKSGGRYEFGSYLMDMSTREMVQINEPGENQVDNVLSPDKTMRAYESVTFSPDMEIIKDELVIADAAGTRLKTILWEDQWLTVLSWLDSDHLILSLDNSETELEDSRIAKPVPMLVLNPFTGARRTLKPAYPNFIDMSVPYWNGWEGIMYDPALTRAIYPSFVDDTKEVYTYTIWDLAKKRPVSDVQSIFTNSAIFDDLYPMPVWSPDGSQFITRGRMIDEPVNDWAELYRVTRDGEVEQLTHLGPTAGVLDTNYSWSPDGKQLAFFMTYNEVAYPQAVVAVLDMATKKVKNYCLPITYAGKDYGGVAPPAPVWSPDSSQFLVTDWNEKNHHRVILVDLAKHSAATVAEDKEAMAWMAAP